MDSKPPVGPKPIGISSRFCPVARTRADHNVLDEYDMQVRELIQYPLEAVAEASRNASCSDETDSFLVRVIDLMNGSFSWELCQRDGRLVLQRSATTFPTRVEALFDSAQGTARLMLDQLDHGPLPSV